MATEKTLASGVNPTSTTSDFINESGQWDYDAINKRIQDLASSFRSPIGGEYIPSESSTLRQAGESPQYNKTFQTAGQAQSLGARNDLLSQWEAMKKQGEAQATQLELSGANTISSMQAADRMQETITAGYTAASSAWETAISTADQYVADSNKRMALLMDKLDLAIQDVGGGLDFAKSHALQSTIAGTVSEMNGTEREIVASYGRNSPEHQQFLQSKSRSMQIAVSNLHYQYDSLRAEMQATMAQGAADVGIAAGGQISTAEQSHVNVLTLAAQAKADYAYKEAELQLQTEQFKALQMENLVSDISGMSVLRLDTLPFLEYLADLKATNHPIPTNSWSVSTPASWSQGMRA